MAKYAVHTKWSWPDGVPSAALLGVQIEFVT